MNKEFKAKWLTALRSGEYKQGRNFLRQTNPNGKDRFCCLGVLCDIVDPTKWKSNEVIKPYDEHITNIPYDLMDNLNLEGGAVGHLMEMNDGNGEGLESLVCSFTEISDWIEKNL